MKSSALLIIGWILLIFSIPVSTQSQTRPSKKEAASSISGKVTIKGKGAPGITVALRTSDPLGRQALVNKGTTDPEGVYRITNVAPGSYQVVPAAPAFIISGDSGGKSLIINAGETVEDIDFNLVRGGVITGKATDSEGRPLIEEQITLMPEQGNNQQRQARWVATMNTQTDDRGIYRIFGIPQGKYTVALGQFEGPRGPRSSKYKQTFHPGVTDPAKAVLIEVTEGSEATNVDITVGRPITTFTATGRIVDGETGRPLANIRYGLQSIVRKESSGVHEESSHMISANLTSDSQGIFKLENLTPGLFAIFLPPQANSEMRADSVSFEIIDQDVTGLLVKASKGASVSGVIALEGTNDKSALSKLTLMRVHAYMEGPGDSWVQPVSVGHDGSFRIGGLQGGIAHFSVNSIDGSPPRGFTLMRIEREGVIQPRGIELKDGEQVTGVRLVLTYGNGAVRGRVKIDNGELPSGANFSVWLSNPGDDPNRPTSTPLPSTQVDSRGHFFVEGLPAGTYEVNAAVYIPESRTAPPRAKQQVNVADGVVTEVTITVSLNLNPGPGNP